MKDKLSILYLIARLGCSGVLAAMLFKMMHWPFGSVLLMLSSGVFFLAYIVHLVLRPNKITRDYYKFGAALFWLSNVISRQFYLGNTLLFTILFLVCLGFMLTSPKRERIAQKSILNTLSTICIYVSIVAIIAGSGLKIMHWPGSSLMIIIGYLLLMIWIVLGAFTKVECVQEVDEIDAIGKS